MRVAPTTHSGYSQPSASTRQTWSGVPFTCRLTRFMTRRTRPGAGISEPTDEPGNFALAGDARPGSHRTHRHERVLPEGRTRRACSKDVRNPRCSSSSPLLPGKPLLDEDPGGASLRTGTAGGGSAAWAVVATTQVE